MYLKHSGIIMFVSALAFFLTFASPLAIGEKKAAQGEMVTNSLGMNFVLIPAGTFMMGSPSDEVDRDKDELQHTVTITKSFYLQSTEVTQRQWREIMGTNPSRFKDCGDNCPVEHLSWDEAQAFIVKLNEREETDKYRLPTEAEWEYACRAGSTTAFANGDITESGCGYDPNLDRMGWYCGNSDDKKHPVAQKWPNDWGLMTCTETSGNGVRTGMGITLSAPLLIPRDLHRAPFA